MKLERLASSLLEPFFDAADTLDFFGLWRALTEHPFTAPVVILVRVAWAIVVEIPSDIARRVHRVRSGKPWRDEPEVRSVEERDR